MGLPQLPTYDSGCDMPQNIVREILDDYCHLRIKSSEPALPVVGNQPVYSVGNVHKLDLGGQVLTKDGMMDIQANFEISVSNTGEEIIEKMGNLLKQTARRLYGDHMINAETFFGVDEATVDQAVSVLTNALKNEQSNLHWLDVDRAEKKVTVNFHQSKGNKEIFDRVNFDALNKRIASFGWKASPSSWVASQRDNPFEFKIILEVVG